MIGRNRAQCDSHMTDSLTDSLNGGSAADRGRDRARYLAHVWKAVMEGLKGLRKVLGLLDHPGQPRAFDPLCLQLHLGVGRRALGCRQLLRQCGRSRHGLGQEAQLCLLPRNLSL